MPAMNIVLRKCYNEIMGNSHCGEYKELLNLISDEIDKLETKEKNERHKTQVDAGLPVFRKHST